MWFQLFYICQRFLNGSGCSLSWFLLYRCSKRIRVLSLSGMFCYHQVDLVVWWSWILLFADGVSSSICCWQRSVEISNSNRMFVYFSSSSCCFTLQFCCLMHILLELLHLLGCLGGSVGLESESWFQLQSRSHGCGMEPRVRLYFVSLESLCLSLRPHSLVARACSLSLKQTKQIVTYFWWIGLLSWHNILLCSDHFLGSDVYISQYR